MRILITTGIYPPKIGGPAQYAKNLKETLEKLGHKVSVKTYDIEDHMPTGVRHLYFFFKIIFQVFRSDVVFALDTFSVGFPSVWVSKILGKKSIIRTGGDFLWEQYVERIRRKVLLKNFYYTEKNNFNQKEKIIFLVTKWTLKNASHIIFSTEWQKSIFIEAYNLNPNKTSMVENYYGPKESDNPFDSREFLASARKLFLKNIDLLNTLFSKIMAQNKEILLFTENLPHNKFIEKMKKCYAVIVPSLSEISPNLILESIRHNKPFICTKEVGIYERIKDAGIFVDPLNEKEIESAISRILTEEGYRKAKEKVKNFNFTHTWEEIAEEFISIYKKL